LSSVVKVVKTLNSLAHSGHRCVVTNSPTWVSPNSSGFSDEYVELQKPEDNNL